MKNSFLNYSIEKVGYFLDYRKLSGKILITLISISVILPTLFSLFFINVVEEKVNDYVDERNESTVLRAKNEIELFFKNPLSIAKLLSFNADVSDKNLLPMNLLFLSTIKEYPIIKEITLLNEIGNLKLFSTRSDYIVFNADSLSPKKLKNNPQFISNVYFDEDNQPLVNIYSSVKKFNQQVSIIKTVIDLKYIWNLVDNIKIGKFGESFFNQF